MRCACALRECALAFAFRVQSSLFSVLLGRWSLGCAVLAWCCDAGGCRLASRPGAVRGGQCGDAVVAGDRLLVRHCGERFLSPEFDFCQRSSSLDCRHLWRRHATWRLAHALALDARTWHAHRRTALSQLGLYAQTIRGPGSQLCAIRSVLQRAISVLSACPREDLAARRAGDPMSPGSIHKACLQLAVLLNGGSQRRPKRRGREFIDPRGQPTRVDDLLI